MIDNELSQSTSHVRFGLFCDDETCTKGCNARNSDSRTFSGNEGPETSLIQSDSDDLHHSGTTKTGLNSGDRKQMHHIKEMKKSYSFGGFGILSQSSFLSSARDPLYEISNQELETMVHPTNKEITKASKIQIKEYAAKYKHVENDLEKHKLPWYREALDHTQGAHMVSIVSMMFISFKLFPDERSLSQPSTFTRLLYIASISMVFGSQIWMTFVSGLALFFNVPRHTFAQVQAVLFPLYFTFNAILMFVVILTYTTHNPTHLWDTHQLAQGIALVLCFSINLLIRLYLAPVLIKLITVKMAIESETGLGNEVGTNQPGVLSRCPHYMKLYRTFRKVHLSIAVGNMAAMAATSFHLYYLATKLCCGRI